MRPAPRYATVTDPITGDGVWLAMRGAALLATPLGAALGPRGGRADARSLRAYVRARRHECGRRALALLLQRGLRHWRMVAAGARPRLAGARVSLS